MNYLVNLNLNGNEIQNFVPQPLATAPANPKPWQMYTNTTTGQVMLNKGTAAEPDWVAIGAVQSVNGKTGAVTLTQDDVDDGETYVRTTNDFTTALKDQIGTNADDIDAIEGKIPAAASTTNQLADKEFVTDSITQGTAIFRGSFATKAALDTVAWQTSDPSAENYVSNNDYAVVLDDETHSDEAWRYIYVLEEGGSNNGWTAQYRINEAPLTQAQLDAINSGITADAVAQIGDTETATEETRSMIADTEASETASQSYDVGDYFIYNDLLYRATAAIAEGGTITPGTNCETVTIGDALANPQEAMTFDPTPTRNSTNPVTSGGVYDAVNGIIQTATGTIPTSGTATTVLYSGTLIDARATMSGSQVITEVRDSGSDVTFAVAQNPSAAVTCTVVYAAPVGNLNALPPAQLTAGQVLTALELTSESTKLYLMSQTAQAPVELGDFTAESSLLEVMNAMDTVASGAYARRFVYNSDEGRYVIHKSNGQEGGSSDMSFMFVIEAGKMMGWGAVMAQANSFTL